MRGGAAAGAAGGVRFELRGTAAWITIDRPEQRNALDEAALAALQAALERGIALAEARVLCLAGAGTQAFCAGGDLASLRAGLAAGAAGVARPGKLFAEILATLWRCPKPTLARVQGAAFGGGLGLALSCDLAVAAVEARFATPEPGAGLFPWMILPVLAAQIPSKILAELVLARRVLDAGEARALGLVNEVVPAAELDRACEERLSRAAAAPPGILAAALPRMRASRLPDLPAALAELEQLFQWNLGQPELAEGLAAFLERRPPRWARP